MLKSGGVSKMRELIRQIKKREIYALVVAIILVDILFLIMGVSASPQNQSSLLEIMRKFSEVDVNSKVWWANTFAFAMINAIEFYMGLIFIKLKYPEDDE